VFSVLRRVFEICFAFMMCEKCGCVPCFALKNAKNGGFLRFLTLFLCFFLWFFVCFGVGG